MNEKQAGQAKSWFNGDPFKRMIALLMGIVTLLASVVGYVQVVNNGYSARAYYQGQQFALQSIGGRARGEILAGYAWSDAYRTWLTLDTQAELIKNTGDEEASQRFLTARDRIANLTPLLSPPYFDIENQDFPNLRTYEADLYIRETAALHENFLNADAVGAAWGEKSGKHIVHLILYTVVLFLYSLTLTVNGGIRWMFVWLSSLIALVTTVWIIQVILTPVTSLPQPAIEFYASGVAWAHQQNYSQAQEAFDEAIQLSPYFANALYERAKVHHLLNQFEQAAADYAAAKEAGRNDVNVYWNAGWNAYLLGDYDQAIELTEQALDLAPDQLALHFNLALAQLASGRVPEAKQSYARGVLSAEQKVIAKREEGKDPPVSLWWYLDAAIVDLLHLQQCIEEKVCEGAPSHKAIAADSQISLTAEHMQTTLQSLAVILEYADQINLETPSQIEPYIGELTFSRGVYDANGVLVSYNPLEESAALLRFGMAKESQGTTIDTSMVRANNTANRDVFVQFQYDGIDKGQLIVMKVYLDDREATGLRLAFPWTLESEGDVSLPLNPGRTLTLTPGDYRVDFFIDGKLLQTGRFEINS